MRLSTIILLIFLGALGLLGWFMFNPSYQAERHQKAYEYVEAGQLKKAHMMYRFMKFSGDEKSVNNYHVLNYNISRWDSSSKVKKAIIEEKTFKAFSKLSEKGVASAAYNAGMMDYRARPGRNNYDIALAHFARGAALGDSLSQDAADFMRARNAKGWPNYEAYTAIADRGNAWAAYRYAESLRQNQRKLKSVGEKYALMGAKAGIADAQAFYGRYFSEKSDAKYWLEKAAHNPENRSLLAAHDLANRAKDRRKFTEQREWLELAIKPREKFRFKIILDPEGLRWRGLQSTILADAGTSQSAAYDLALMQISGEGGPVDKKAAIKNLEKAGERYDAPLLLAKLKSGKRAGKETTANSDLEIFDEKNLERHYSSLRPLIKRKDIRLATALDLKKFGASSPMRIRKVKAGREFRKSGDLENCTLGFNCFYMERAIRLPDDMYGAHSAMFLISPNVYFPEQAKSHNQYVFLNDFTPE